MIERLKIGGPVTFCHGIWKHEKTGGLYRVISEGKRESDGEPVVIYTSVATQQIWVRPKTEFLDGRFSLVKELIPPELTMRKMIDNHHAEWLTLRSAAGEVFDVNSPDARAYKVILIDKLALTLHLGVISETLCSAYHKEIMAWS